MIGKPFERVFRFPLMPNFEIERGCVERAAFTRSPHDLLTRYPVTHLHQTAQKHKHIGYNSYLRGRQSRGSHSP